MEKLIRLRDELSSLVIDTNDMVDGLLLGMLTGQHLLFIGPPGTGKSMLANAFFSRLSEGRSFSYLMTQFTRPEEIIGPVSLKGLESDDFTRILKGRIADAHFVFLDEIFNAGSSCANTILTILNERSYHNGSEKIPVPLITLLGAANEIPSETDNQMRAFYDRFLFRYQLEYITEADKLKRLFESTWDSSKGEACLESQQDKVTFTLEDVYRWQELVRRVEVPEDIVRSVVCVVTKLREAGVNISDRRLVQSRTALQGHAALRGRQAVTMEDLRILDKVFWNVPEDRRILGDILKIVSVTLEVQVSELVREAQQILAKFNTFNDYARKLVLGGEINLRLTEIENRLSQIGELSGMPTPMVNDGLRKVKEIHDRILGECLQFEARTV